MSLTIQFINRQVFCLFLVVYCFSAGHLFSATPPGQDFQAIQVPDSIRDSSASVRVKYLCKEGYARTASAPDSALMFFKTAEAEARAAGDSVSLLKAINDIGHFMMSRGINGPALEYIYSGEELAYALGDTTRNIFFLFWKSRLYNELGDFERSMDACEKAMALDVKHEERSWSLNYYGEALRGAGLLERARDSLTLGTAEFRKADDPIGFIMVRAKLARVYQQLGNSEEVKEQAGHVFHYWKRVGGYESFLSITGTLMDVDLEQGELDSAEHRGLYALEQVEGKKYYRLMIEIAEKLVLVYEQKKDFEQALRYMRMAEKLESEFEFDKVGINLAVKDAEFLNERLVGQNELLMEQKRGQLYLTIGMGLVLLLVIVLAFFQLRANRKSREFNKVLQSKNLDLDEKNAALDGLNREKDMLMQIVAHDLKSPLNSVMGLSDMLRGVGELNEVQGEVLDKMDMVSKRGIELIHNLLDLSAVEDGKMEAKPVELDLSTILQKVVGDFKVKASQKDIQLHLEISPDSVPVLTDPFHYERIVSNLVSNAIKYSPKGKNVWIALQVKSKRLETLVRDEGPGISADDRKKMFGKFQRLSARPTDGESSNGLGLSIVKSFAEQIGGEVKVNSKPGEGAEFVLSIPSNGSA